MNLLVRRASAQQLGADEPGLGNEAAGLVKEWPIVDINCLLQDRDVVTMECCDEWPTCPSRRDDDSESIQGPKSHG